VHIIKEVSNNPADLMLDSNNLVVSVKLVDLTLVDPEDSDNRVDSDKVDSVNLDSFDLSMVELFMVELFMVELFMVEQPRPEQTTQLCSTTVPRPQAPAPTESRAPARNGANFPIKSGVGSTSVAKIGRVLAPPSGHSAPSLVQGLQGPFAVS